MNETRRPDASMSLLNDLWQEPVEGDYAQAARTREYSRPVALSRSGVVLVVAAVLGVVLSGAVVGLRGPTQALTSSRDLLIAEIDDRRNEADALVEVTAELETEVEALQAEVLAGRNPGLLAELEATGAVAGTVAVGGPGLVVELSDGPDTDESESNRVQDVDLQVVVNGLWASGAEAIAVNGQRLTSLSAIRSASQVVLVDLVPLTSPYVIEAIGDPADLQTTFAATQASSHLGLLSSAYSIGVQVNSSTDLLLPGDASPRLAHASVVDVASSAPTDQEGSP